MMNPHRRIDLVFFTGCPHAGAARANLEAALRLAGHPLDWNEWDLHDAHTPAWAVGYASPTLLVEGEDVTGAEPSRGQAGMSCRAGGPPSSAQILRALTGVEPESGPSS